MTTTMYGAYHAASTNPMTYNFDSGFSKPNNAASPSFVHQWTNGTPYGLLPGAPASFHQHIDRFGGSAPLFDPHMHNHNSNTLQSHAQTPGRVPYQHQQMSHNGQFAGYSPAMQSDALFADTRINQYDDTALQQSHTTVRHAGHCNEQSSTTRATPGLDLRASAGPSVSRVTKSPRATKKSKTTKATVPHKTPKLEQPLSVLTRDMHHVPLRDMATWVNRPMEMRQHEVAKRNGYVTRPMNSFMLYRSAYAERTKMWCLQNNHQVVSAVSGESWPLEPDSVREHFNELARIERDNHARAHPDYKFSPSKVGALKKRKDDDSEDEESVSIDTDFDGEWAPAADRRARPKPRARKPQSPPIFDLELPSLPAGDFAHNAANIGTLGDYSDQYLASALQQNMAAGVDIAAYEFESMNGALASSAYPNHANMHDPLAWPHDVNMQMPSSEFDIGTLQFGPDGFPLDPNSGHYPDHGHDMSQYGSWM